MRAKPFAPALSVPMTPGPNPDFRPKSRIFGPCHDVFDSRADRMQASRARVRLGRGTHTLHLVRIPARPNLTQGDPAQRGLIQGAMR